MKTNHYWGIASGLLLLPFTIRLRRKDAIDDFLEYHEGRTTWEQWK